MTDASAHQRRAATDYDPARPLALARAALDAAPAGLLTDLDGTLAPIVRDPDSARPLPAAVEALHALQARLAVVAVITGRAGADARRMLGSDQLLVVANHGLEWLEPGAAATPAREDLAWAPEAVRAALSRVRLDDGSWIEDKTLSATLHFRNAADPEAVRQRLRQELGDLEPMGLVVRPGRMSLEIRPAAAGNKGTAPARRAGHGRRHHRPRHVPRRNGGSCRWAAARCDFGRGRRRGSATGHRGSRRRGAA
jgi:trehalose-phosphatase